MSLFAKIVAVEYYLPQGLLTNDELERVFPDWPASKILEKTGIRERHIAAPGETAADLAFGAASALFAKHDINPAKVDFVILCSQAPDYLLPTTACLLQDRLKLSTACGALDINLGCSGYVYGLSLAKALIESGIRKHVLLLTADTYSKFIHPQDRSVRTLFGDGAAATLVSATELPGAAIGPFILGTDGSGGDNLIVPAGGARVACDGASAVEYTDASGNTRSRNNLFMDGPEIMNFTLSSVPRVMQELLAAAGKTLDDIDHVIFHQANNFMLQALRKKIKIPEAKFIIEIDTVGNTVSSTIPIAIARACKSGRIKSGDSALLLGFGVGYSWAGTIVDIP